MQDIQKLLIDLDACEPAKEWAAGKTWEEIFNTCHRGDWLLWLFRRTNPNDKKAITLAKGHCANTVRHLMKDERSINAVDVAIRYGNGDATDKELAAAYAAAYAAADAAAYAAAAAAYAAAYAAADAADAADAAAAYAAAYAAAAAAADAADAAADAADALKESQMATANICRQYLPIGIWNI